MTDYETGFASWSDPFSLDYRTKQWVEQKESTKAFNEFFNQSKSSTRVIDLGAGTSASTYFLAQNHPKTSFIGVDQSEELIEIANGIQITKKAANLSFEVGN